MSDQRTPEAQVTAVELGGAVEVSKRADGRFGWMGKVLSLSSTHCTVEFFYDHDRRLYSLSEVKPVCEPCPSDASTCAYQFEHAMHQSMRPGYYTCGCQEPRTKEPLFPVRTCQSCGKQTTSTSTIDHCVACGDSDGLRPRHFLTRDEPEARTNEAPAITYEQARFRYCAHGKTLDVFCAECSSMNADAQRPSEAVKFECPYHGPQPMAYWQCPACDLSNRPRTKEASAKVGDGTKHSDYPSFASELIAWLEACGPGVRMTSWQVRDQIRERWETRAVFEQEQRLADDAALCAAAREQAQCTNEAGFATVGEALSKQSEMRLEDVIRRVKHCHRHGYSVGSDDATHLVQEIEQRTKARINPGVRVRMIGAPAMAGKVDGWCGPSSVTVQWEGGHRNVIMVTALEVHPEQGPNEARLLIADRAGVNYDPNEVADALDSLGDRHNAATGEALHSAADVMRGLALRVAPRTDSPLLAATMGLDEAIAEMLAQSIDDYDCCRICGGLNGGRKGHESNCAVVLLAAARDAQRPEPAVYPPKHRVNEEASRQETYTYPPCGVSKCEGTIRTMMQDRARKCGACLEKKA